MHPFIARGLDFVRGWLWGKCQRQQLLNRTENFQLGNRALTPRLLEAALEKRF
jgi:hypothetical protein